MKIKKHIFLISVIILLILLVGCSSDDNNEASELCGEEFILSLVNCEDAYISRGFGGYEGHKGVDIAAPEGVEIYAADNGVVTTVVNMNMGYGIHCIIGHESYDTLYAHCQKLIVDKGDIVKKGDIIGYVGNTGNSTGPHLHFEVISDDVKYDPVEWYK